MIFIQQRKHALSATTMARGKNWPPRTLRQCNLARNDSNTDTESAYKARVAYIRTEFHAGGG
jgi:hypothetical protein